MKKTQRRGHVPPTEVDLDFATSSASFPSCFAYALPVILFILITALHAGTALAQTAGPSPSTASTLDGKYEELLKRMEALEGRLRQSETERETLIKKIETLRVQSPLVGSGIWHLQRTARGWPPRHDHRAQPIS